MKYFVPSGKVATAEIGQVKYSHAIVVFLVGQSEDTLVAFPRGTPAVFMYTVFQLPTQIESRRRDCVTLRGMRIC
jgi:hypothetical protein